MISFLNEFLYFLLFLDNEELFKVLQVLQKKYT